MSRIGKKPVPVPNGVKVNVEKDGQVRFEGPKGKLSFKPHVMMKVHTEANTVVVERPDDSREAKSLHGLTRTLIENAVVGVSQGFERKLSIQGVGYRAELKGKTLHLNLGFSHVVEYPLPEGVTAEVTDRVQLKLHSINKQLLGETAAKVRSFRPPEPYGGKGIRYADEVVRMKEGKSGSK